MNREAVVLNPYQYYADRFIRALYDQHGVRTVALHTDWRTRLIRQPRMEVLNSPAVTAHYMVPAAGIDSLAPLLRRHHHVVGVLPHDEGAVAPLVRLGRELGLEWADQRVLTAIGSKGAVKELVRATDPTIPLNRFARVSGSSDTVQWVRSTGVRRFVLKPDAGSGNRGVAFFDADPLDEPAISAYFADHRGPTLAEEYVAGTEYWVNGQCDAAGRPLVTGIGVYDRRSVNGKENVEVGSRTIPRSDPTARILESYAERVLGALDLRRSPFHLEAKVDDQVPCLIEVGTRLCGEKQVATDSWQFGVDLVELAVADYVTPGRTVAPHLDIERYDSRRVVSINGSAVRRDVIARVEGVREVEGMPEFLMWIKKPKVGNTVVPTRDLIANSWSVHCWGPDDEALDATTRRVREAIRLVGVSEARGARDRWPVTRERIGRYWRARPRPAMLRSWWATRSL